MMSATGTAASTHPSATSRLLGATCRSHRLAKTNASTSARPTLANSDGCTVNPATTGIQERDPLIVTPSGVRTAMRPRSERP
jgi:hypothetical protein